MNIMSSGLGEISLCGFDVFFALCGDYIDNVNYMWW